MIPGIAGSRVYGSFLRGLHVRSLSPIEYRRPISWLWDFNVEPMVSIIAQRTPTGKFSGSMFRVHRVLVLEEGNIFEMVDMFKSFYPAHGAEVWIYGDATGQRRSDQSGRSNYQLIVNAMKTYSAPIRLKLPEANPHVSDRLASVNRLLKNEYGEIGVEINDEHCDDLIFDFEQVLSDGHGGIKKTFDRKNSYFKRTHSSDAFGYWVMREEPVKPAGNPLARRVTVKSPSYKFTHRRPFA